MPHDIPISDQLMQLYQKDEKTHDVTKLDVKANANLKPMNTINRITGHNSKPKRQKYEK